MKKVLIISTSLRKNSNSEALAREFEKGAAEAGCQTEFISLAGKKIDYCAGCLACEETGQCVMQDDAVAIAEQMKNAEAIVFATPIYFYEMSGQMKTLLDRTYPLYPAEYAFRDIYLLATAMDDNENAMDGAVKGLEGWIACFEKTRLAGVVRGYGVDGAGEINDHPDLLAEAYAMGKAV